MITGTTRVIAHLGVPTENFRAPMIYNPYFEAAGIDAVVVPMGCGVADFPVFLKTIARLTNFAGALITMPHKISVVQYLDEISTAVAVCGSCNAVKRLSDGRLLGDMFDGQGFVRAADRHDRPVRGASALVVGCGGVGAAIAVALAEAGAAKVGLCDIDAGKCHGLNEQVSAQFPKAETVVASNDPAGWDIVVNATALGMNPNDSMPMDPGRLSADTFVGEVVLCADDTPFVRAARARGCTVQVGVDMLFEMIPAYLSFFGLPTTSAAELRRLARL